MQNWLDGKKNYYEKFTKSILSTLITSTIWKNLKPDIIKNGFERSRTSSFFFNKVVPPVKFQAEAYQRWPPFLEKLNSEPEPSTSREEDVVAASQ